MTKKDIPEKFQVDESDFYSWISWPKVWSCFGSKIQCRFVPYVVFGGRRLFTCKYKLQRKWSSLSKQRVREKQKNFNISFLSHGIMQFQIRITFWLECLLVWDHEKLLKVSVRWMEPFRNHESGRGRIITSFVLVTTISTSCTSLRTSWTCKSSFVIEKWVLILFS